jgi:hypothetical protein
MKENTQNNFEDPNDEANKFVSVEATYQQQSKSCEAHLRIFAKYNIPSEENLPKLKNTGYNFEHDFFTLNAAYWKIFFSDLGWIHSEIQLKILEVGSYEGRSACWLLENLARNSKTEIFCVDLFNEGGGKQYIKTYPKRFVENCNNTGRGNQIKIMKGLSCSVLPSLINEHKGTFDLIYIDGSHRPIDVLTDACNSFYLLKVGGFLIFDDYGRDSGDEVPCFAIDSFLICVNQFKPRVKILKKCYQCFLQKIDD